MVQCFETMDNSHLLGTLDGHHQRLENEEAAEQF